MDYLEKEEVLGADGACDARTAVQLIRRTNWVRVPKGQGNRMLSGQGSVRRTGEVGDFIWVNLHEWQAFPESDARYGRSWSYGEDTPFPKARNFDLRMWYDCRLRTFERHSEVELAVQERASSQEPETGLVLSNIEKNAVTAMSPNSEGSGASDRDVRFVAKAGKQPQPSTVGPSDDDSQDQISAVQWGAKPSKEAEAIVLFSDSDRSSNDYGSLPREERRARRRRSHRSFRIFDLDSAVRTYLPQGVKTKDTARTSFSTSVKFFL